MSANVTKVFIGGMGACTDEQRAEIEAALREHNAEAVSEEEFLRHLQEVALQEERQMQELRDKMQTYHLYRKPEIVARPRIDLSTTKSRCGSMHIILYRYLCRLTKT